jgi:hypothetical protein
VKGPTGGHFKHPLQWCLFMDANQTSGIKTDELGFIATVIVALLFLLPSCALETYGVFVSMAALSVVGLIGYIFVYGERLRSRGQMKTLVVVAVAGFASTAAMAIGLLLETGR